MSLVDAFAALTGDRSSLHVDDAVARRSRYRRRVAHGMLPLASLAMIQLEHPQGHIRFQRLKGRFLRPLWPGEQVSMRIEIAPAEGDLRTFSATLVKLSDASILTRVTGAYRVVSAPGAPSRAESAASGFCDETLVELDQGMDALEGRRESLRWRPHDAALTAFAVEILGPMGVELAVPPCPNLIATLMMSPLVGMRLPGRRATFLSFDLAFKSDISMATGCEITGTVTHRQPAADLMKADVEVRDGVDTVATGALETLVNPPPSRMPSCAELSASALDLGLTGKVAVVVGGSRGIGETTAKLLALLGARVTLTYFRGRNDAERIVAEIREHGGVADCALCDVRDETQVSALMREIAEREGGIDILVNCAVHDFSPMPAMDARWDDYLAELEVSVKGYHATCRGAVPVMRKAGRGKIINFSSVAVRIPVSGQSRYITAKSAVEGYTRSLAQELAGSNIQVNLVIPGMTETDLVAAIPTTYRDRLSAARASGRHVGPAEVAQAVAFLSSQWSNAMTGQAVVLNLGEPPFV
ncbi:MAG: SDR family oxidoreductase [Aquisalimonadaceae bacterium]